MLSSQALVMLEYVTWTDVQARLRETQQKEFNESQQNDDRASTHLSRSSHLHSKNSDEVPSRYASKKSVFVRSADHAAAIANAVASSLKEHVDRRFSTVSSKPPEPASLPAPVAPPASANDASPHLSLQTV
jgi:hypothetical protein